MAADNFPETYMLPGMSAGAATGAVIAGPVGLLIGGVIGAVIGVNNERIQQGIQCEPGSTNDRTPNTKEIISKQRTISCWIITTW